MVDFMVGEGDFVAYSSSKMSAMQIELRGVGLVTSISAFHRNLGC